MSSKFGLLRSNRKSIAKKRLSVEPLEDRRVLATFTVMNNADSGAGSLRQAVLDANAMAGADTIDFAPALGGATITLTSGQLTVTGSVTIDGPAAKVTIAGPGDVATGFRIFKINDGNDATLISVSMDDLIIRGGSAKPEANTDDGQTAIRDIGRGGGIDSRENLTLDRVTLTNNFARRGGNLSVAAPSGQQATQNLAVTTIRNSTISNGRSDWASSGGTLGGRAGVLSATNAGTITIEDSVISDNYGYIGGHMDIRNGTFLTIRRTTMSGGMAYLRSSAIYAQRGSTQAAGPQLDNAVTLDDVTVEGGNTVYSDSTRFGAVHMLAGSLTITNSRIRNNTGETGVDSWRGGTAFAPLVAAGMDPSTRVSITNTVISGNDKGGIGSGNIVGSDALVLNSGTEWTLSGLTITNNGTLGDAYSYGGVILVDPEATIANATISGNNGDFGGGILLLSPLAFSISNSTISNNNANTGAGGIDVEGGNATILRSTISGNSGVGFAGGIRVLGLSPDATTAFPQNATVNISQSTISGNSTDGEGGGVLALSQVDATATLIMDGCTVTLNTAGLDVVPPVADRGTGGGISASSYTSDPVGYYSDTAVTLKNTIVSGNSDNTTAKGPDIYSDLLPRTVFTGTFNFVGKDGTNSPFPAGNPGPGGNKVGTVAVPLNAMLGPLANNGGTTMTHLPMTGSPVIDMGDPTTVSEGVTTDQRGATRVVNGRVDIGSVEVQAATLDLDFNNDNAYNCGDMDLLEAAIDGGVYQAAFDVNGDNLLNKDDVFAWLMDAGELRFGTGRFFKLGDANLDGTVDGQDFITWNTNKFSTDDTWCEGDFNQDDTVDGQDFIIWNSNKFTSSDAGRPAGANASLTAARSATSGARQSTEISARRLGAAARDLEPVDVVQKVAKVKVPQAAPAALRVASTEKGEFVSAPVVSQLSNVESTREQSGIQLTSRNLSFEVKDQDRGGSAKRASAIDRVFANLELEL